MAKSGNKFEVEITGKIDGLQKAVNQSRDEIGSLGKAAKGMAPMFKAVGGAIAGAFTIGAIVNFQKAIVSTTADFQRFRAVLTTALGSQGAADAAMMNLQKFASETPFQLSELTDAFIRMTNQGFKPTMDEMTMLGDLASSTGKSFSQLAEAILDAQTGEYERLKEFGIKASAEGDKVTFTFKGVATEVDNTAKSIQGYLLGLGKLEGVTGSMAAISETLGGRISNLGDAVDTLYKTIGDAQNGPLADLLKLAIDTVSMMNAIGETDYQKGLKGGLEMFSLIAREGRDAALVTEDYESKIGSLKKRLETLKGTLNAGEQSENADAKKYAELRTEMERVTGQIAGMTTAFEEFSKGGSSGVGVAVESMSLLLKQLESLQKSQLDAPIAEWQKWQKEIDAVASKIDGIKKAGRGSREAANLTNLPTPTVSTGIQGGGEITRVFQSPELTYEQVAALSELKDGMELYNESLWLTQNLTAGIGTAFADAIVSGADFGEAMKQILAETLKQLIAMVVQAAALAAIMSALGGGAFGSVFGKIFGGLKSGSGTGINIIGEISGEIIRLSGQRAGYQKGR